MACSRDEVVNVLADEFGIAAASVKDSDKLRDLGDSMELAYLALALEDALAVTVEQRDILTLKTVADLVSLAEKLTTQ